MSERLYTIPGHARTTDPDTSYEAAKVNLPGKESIAGRSSAAGCHRQVLALLGGHLALVGAHGRQARTTCPRRGPLRAAVDVTQRRAYKSTSPGRALRITQEGIRYLMENR